MAPQLKLAYYDFREVQDTAGQPLRINYEYLFTKVDVNGTFVDRLVTYAHVRFDNSKIDIIGRSVYNPNDEKLDLPFNRQIGREEALKKALRLLGYDEEQMNTIIQRVRNYEADFTD